MNSIGERLKTARLAAGFATVEEAAEAMGVNYQTYAGHENGRSGFKSDSVVRYCKKFKISTDWLLTGKGKGPRGEHDVAWEIFLIASNLPQEELERAKRIMQAVAEGAKTG
ncbi:helix-turn-helix domain-containing protein [Agrobacterium vitis]|uniref:helix-turn-helix domain-containing protein n=1 Tax=Agrobacterium vitis TaxID=373 RepID=UPI0012E888F2|nr:helix-turn-helix transcriptional regulator [Agrobacterium vitis]MVA47353.1 helix-turn-helix domain-containing protein [Agrobacterium vitis]